MNRKQREELQIESYYWNEVNSLQQQIERNRKYVDFEIADFDTLWTSALRQNNQSREILLSIQTTETLFNLTLLQYSELEKISEKRELPVLSTAEEELRFEISRLNEIIRKVAKNPEQGILLARQEIMLQEASERNISQKREEIQRNFTFESEMKLKISEESEKKKELLISKLPEKKIENSRMKKEIRRAIMVNQRIFLKFQKMNRKFKILRSN